MNRRYHEMKTQHLPMLPNPRIEPLIDLISNREAVIEGSKGIVQYSDTSIDINCKCFILRFTGFDMSIKTLSSDSIAVNGNITQIDFLQCEV